MRTPPRLAVSAFLGAAALWFASQLTLLTAGLRTPTDDDLMVARAITDPAYSADIRVLDFEMGRIYSGIKFSFLEWVLQLQPDWLHAAARIAMVVLAAGAAAWFTWVWRRKSGEALLVFAVSLGLMQISLSYQALLSQQWFWLGWTALWIMGALALQPDSTANRSGIALAFAAALVGHESNAAFVLWPVALRAVGRGEKIFWAALRPFWACAVVLVVYGGLSLAVRQQMTDTRHIYGGTVLSPDLGRFALAWNVFSLSTVPGVEAWRVRWSDPGFPSWLTPAQWLEQLRAWTDLASLIGATLVGAVVWLGLARDEAEPDARASRAHPVAMLALLIAAAYAPNLLLAATIKYQGWAQQRMWPYYYSSMSYLAWMVFFVTGIGSALSALRRPGGHAIGRALAAGLAVVIALSVFSSSREALAYLRREPLHHIKGYPHGPLK